MKRSNILALALIALISTGSIACGVPSRYEELIAMQKQRELTSNEKECGTVVVSGLIKEEKDQAQGVIPKDMNLLSPIIVMQGAIWIVNGKRYSRIEHVSANDWKVIWRGPWEPLETCEPKSSSNNNSDKHITLTASLIAVNAQPSGVNYEHLAQSLEQLHKSNTSDDQGDTPAISLLEELD
jgi:hypothetical protein